MPTLEAIEYCIKMLLAMAVLGGTNTKTGTTLSLYRLMRLIAATEVNMSIKMPARTNRLRFV
jgi:hypothetical protein